MMNSHLPIQAIKIGIDDYLLKPFTREELTEAVQKAVQGLEQAEAAGSEKKLENMGEGKTKYEIMSHAIEEYLNQNYGKKSLSLQEVATAMGFENSYLRRVYKMTKGYYDHAEARRYPHHESKAVSGIRELSESGDFRAGWFFRSVLFQ